jgi:hypothetical protein
MIRNHNICKKSVKKVVNKIGRNWWKELADTIFTDSVKIGTNLIPDTIIDEQEYAW